MKKFFIFIISVLIISGIEGQSVRKKFKSEGWSGNPVFEGWYADPEGIIYGDQFWIFPTLSDFYGEALAPPELSPDQKELQKNTINPQSSISHRRL